MKQEDMFDKIRKSAENVPVPEGLSPEEMFKKLPGKKSKITYIYRWGAAAAMLAAMLTVWKSGELRRPAEAVYESAPETMASPRMAMKSLGPENITQGQGADHNIRYAEEYTDVYKVLEDYLKEPKYDEYCDMEAGAVAETAASPAAMAAPMEQKSATGGSLYSDTNVQVQGVDEGDIVKTDGSYIYVLDENREKIHMIKADGTVTELTGSISVSNYIREFYLYEDKIMVISEIHGPDYTAAQADTYDVSDKENPKHIGSVTQDGIYNSSRSSGGYLYLFTTYWPEYGVKQKDVDKYIPKVNDQLIPAADICIPDVVNGSATMVISSINWKEPGQAADKKSVLASGEIFYVSGENIYIGSSNYDSNSNQYNYTELMKFSYKDGQIEFKAQTNVDGSLNNQFSLDEYKGNLRVVSTLSYSGSATTNSLSIYNADLELTGEIEDMAAGETIYSARLMGDIGYFVTFRNMDPLFSVDLSDPSAPKVLGELKITGFSEYLHPYSDGLLWGLGREIAPDTGAYKGLKLSMFDTSDPKHVTEEHKMVEETIEYSPAWNNHKAVLASTEKNLIGFAAAKVEKPSRVMSEEYLIYSYTSQKGFEKKLEFELINGYQEAVRGIFINNYIYIVENNRITVFVLEDFSQQAQMSY